ncbi:hypothetical protein BJ508DRAFT_336300 [Ascobolus immersus RN42]|uniref:Uncharacterized protein n=1 Tax=Ascobolus immersus RN42 TaxID=1160509 RepID=A0A3N4HBM5_ASCIM|nr:hypothetical protein BJ508DRAFT_336300 [Ascobolus immersus RN42]
MAHSPVTASPQRHAIICTGNDGTSIETPSRTITVRSSIMANPGRDGSLPSDGITSRARNKLHWKHPSTRRNRYREQPSAHSREQSLYGAAGSQTPVEMAHSPAPHHLMDHNQLLQHRTSAPSKQRQKQAPHLASECVGTTKTLRNSTTGEPSCKTPPLHPEPHQNAQYTRHTRQLEPPAHT